MSSSKNLKRDELIEQYTQEQFAALGEFVQEFERMVDHVRTACVFMLGPSKGSQEEVMIVLEHSVMTAKVLHDVFDCIIALRIRRMVENNQITESESIVANEILLQLRKEYQDLSAARNTLLHSTWSIGAGNKYMEAEEYNEIHMHKYFITRKKGVELKSEVNSVADLRALIERCRINGRHIYHFYQCVLRGIPFDKFFIKNKDGRWYIGSIAPPV